MVTTPSGSDTFKSSLGFDLVLHVLNTASLLWDISLKICFRHTVCLRQLKFISSIEIVLIFDEDSELEKTRRAWDTLLLNVVMVHVAVVAGQFDKNDIPLLYTTLFNAFTGGGSWGCSFYLELVPEPCL
ncbi:hypothetical protein Tco_0392482 [Tanacetum coccineum]